MKPSPECPIRVELLTLAANKEAPTTNQFCDLPAKKYSLASLFFLFFKIMGRKQIV